MAGLAVLQCLSDDRSCPSGHDELASSEEVHAY